MDAFDRFLSEELPDDEHRVCFSARESS